MTDQNNPETQGSEAPSVPEKFLNADGELDTQKLLQSYTELEKMNTQSRQATKDSDTETPQIPDARGDGPLTLDHFQAEFEEFAQNGELSDETWAGLERKTGLHRDVIQDYAESRGIRQAYEMQKAYEPYGGREAVDQALEWASTNLDPTEIQEINEDFKSGGRLGVRALGDLMNRFNAATGGADQINPRGGARDPGTRGFSTAAERRAAMAQAMKTGDMSEYDARLAATKNPSALT